jgi:hypothetical protein
MSNECGRWDDGHFCELPADHTGSHVGGVKRPLTLPGHETTNTDPDDLGTFGEVLEHWTRRGGPTPDERTAFWMSWSRHTIAWVFAVAGCLIVKSMYGGLVDTITAAVGAAAVVALAYQVVEAIRFGRECRRWQS